MNRAFLGLAVLSRVWSSYPRAASEEAKPRSVVAYFSSVDNSIVSFKCLVIIKIVMNDDYQSRLDLEVSYIYMANFTSKNEEKEKIPL